MKKIFYFFLVFVLYAVYAEETVTTEQPAELQPVDVVPETPVPKAPIVTLDTLLQNRLLLESMQVLVHETDKQLQIQFSENTKNVQLVMELQDKLVAFGLPFERIHLLPVKDQNEGFLFEIVEKPPYQEQVIEPES